MKYKLLKDLPGIPKGSISTSYDPHDEMAIFECETDAVYHPISVQKYPDWVVEIEEATVILLSAEEQQEVLNDLHIDIISGALYEGDVINAIKELNKRGYQIVKI